MRALGTIAIGIIAALAACSGPSTGQAPVAQAVAEAEGDAYKMFSVVGIGDIALTDDALVTSDGERIPVEMVSEGVYALPSQPSKLTNGEDFCFDNPVTYFTWHRHDEGLWVMNVGQWRAPPAVPAATEWQAEGGCGLFTYSPA